MGPLAQLALDFDSEVVEVGGLEHDLVIDIGSLNFDRFLVILFGSDGFTQLVLSSEVTTKGIVSGSTDKSISLLFKLVNLLPTFVNFFLKLDGLEIELPHPLISEEVVDFLGWLFDDLRVLALYLVILLDKLEGRFALL